jgi:MFS family permease
VGLPHGLRALRSPNFRRYYLGQMVSMIGTWMQSVAFMWLAYRLTGSTAFTGLIGFLNSVPYLVVSPLAGVMGDRVDRRRMLMAVLTLLALQSAVLAVLTGLELITPAQVLVLALASGIFNALETPTRQSIFVLLLEKREDLPNAIAMNSLLMNGTRLVGPSVGGIVVALHGETLCFALNAVSYGAVVGALASVRLARQPPRAPSHPFADLAEGWRYSMGELPVRRILFALAMVSFAISPYATLMPAVAVQVFGEGPELVGFFFSCLGAGALFAAGNLAQRSNMRGLGRWIPMACVAAGLGALGFGLSRAVWLSAVLIAIAGFGMFALGVTCNTILQAVVEEEKRSRVMSYYTMFFIGSAPFGHYAGGWAAELIGVRATFVVGGLLSIATGLWFAAQMPRFRSELRAMYVRRGIIPASENTQMANP